MKQLEIFTKTDQIREFCRNIPRTRVVGFVPTMGCLHRGHISLVERSLRECDITIVSIYVNPLQFGVGEDFDKYPRTLGADIDLLTKAGVDAVFIPEKNELGINEYENSVAHYNSTVVDMPHMSKKYCGKSRPGHFAGVMKVIIKLLNIISPNVMYLGEKDYQQYFIINQMLKDLNFYTEARLCPIVRENDGLAMSSRNRYLNAKERQNALCLWKSIQLSRSLYKNREKHLKIHKTQITDLIIQHNGVIDYIAFVDNSTLYPVLTIKRNTRLLLAVKIGETRLIDNGLLEL